MKERRDGRALFFLQKKHCSFFSFLPFSLFNFSILPFSLSRGLLFVRQMFYCFAYLGDNDVVIMLVKHV